MAFCLAAALQGQRISKLLAADETIDGEGTLAFMPLPPSGILAITLPEQVPSPPELWEKPRDTRKHTSVHGALPVSATHAEVCELHPDSSMG